MLRPSTRARTETSVPSRRSSITTSRPASPNIALDHDAVDGVDGLGERGGDDDALALGEARGLDHGQIGAWLGVCRRDGAVGAAVLIDDLAAVGGVAVLGGGVG